MLTKFQILRVGAEPEDREVDLDEQPGYHALAALIEPLLDDKSLEYVAVLHNSERRDMFVDECGAIDGLPRNEAATAIYRNNWLTRFPATDPEKLPAIYGTAILFPDRQVWF